MPIAVQGELSDSRAPVAVQRWIGAPPAWLEIHDTAHLPLGSGSDDGETAAIALGESLGADMILIDERDGYRVALRKGLRATGTLGLLDLAAQRGLIDFAPAILALEQTTFRLPDALLNALLAKQKDQESR